jgi:hypothetical protein
MPWLEVTLAYEAAACLTLTVLLVTVARIITFRRISPESGVRPMLRYVCTGSSGLLILFSFLLLVFVTVPSSHVHPVGRCTGLACSQVYTFHITLGLVMNGYTLASLLASPEAVAYIQHKLRNYFLWGR